MKRWQTSKIDSSGPKVMKPSHLLALASITLGLVALACSISSPEGPPKNAQVIEVWANTGLEAWLQSVVESFNDESFENPLNDKPIYVTLKPVESGQAVRDLAAGATSPALWLPDQGVWAEVLADQGFSNFQGDCLSVATSPLVIAMWRPIAEALGWPGRALGWLDVGSLAADPSAWAYYSGGQFGDRLRLGHTHPGLSASGAETLLAVVQAAQSKADAVTVEDVQLPIVQASVGAFESAVSWFSSTTGSLGQTMSERGIGYLGAAIIYESTVVQYGRGDPEIVAIFPFEGTFVATHPACLNLDADEETRRAGQMFRDALIGSDAQTQALDYGLRPVNPAVWEEVQPTDVPWLDLNQPTVIFDPPSVETLYAVQSLWQSARKDVNLVMLLDVSGSMRGQKLERLQEAAIRFMDQMGDDDFISLVAFAEAPNVLIDHQPVGSARQQAINVIAGLTAGGSTTLYDAIGVGSDVIAESTASAAANAMVVLTDGMDTASVYFDFDQELIDAAVANDTTVFTIAYGSDADEDLLEELAMRAHGNFYLGDEASIAAIYEEMSAAFGGNVGIGR